MDYQKISDRYKHELTNSVIPFWENHAIDQRYGGYITCLDREGAAYDTTKYLWMQWRIVYMFAELSRNSGGNTDWNSIAEQGYDFLTRHGKVQDGSYYFALTQDGSPAVAPYSIYTEYFAALGSAALYSVTGKEACRKEALEAADRYMSRIENPKGKWEKKLSGWPKRKTLGHYMMLLNLWDALESFLGITDHQTEAPKVIDEILNTFWNREYKIIFENVCANDSVDLGSQEGRHLNPGHALEALWFIMDYAQKHDLHSSATKAAAMVIPTLEFSWDTRFGGIRYFMDALGKPHIDMEADMKLWWVHCEASLALLYMFAVTDDHRAEDWFKIVDDWTWERFPDHESGEWYGYLDRSGAVSNSQKGGKWKTFFHLPRQLLIGSRLIEDHLVGRGE